MEDNTSIYDRGITLLKNAVKKYEQGDNEGAEKDRQLANQLLDQATMNGEADEIQLDDAKLYGENRNFGIIYNVIEENAKLSFKDNKQLKKVANVIKYIKSNDILKEELNIYSTLENIKVEDADSYINEAVAILPKLSKKEIVKANEELIGIIRENKLNEFININEDKISLYEAIEFIILNKKTLQNINEYNSNKLNIKEHIEKNSLNEQKDVDNESMSYDAYKNDVIKTIDRLSEGITEDEEMLLKELNENSKEEIFNKYKNETVKMISEQISTFDSLKEKIDWNNILTRVSLKTFNENKLFEDVASFINIQNIITE